MPKTAALIRGFDAAARTFASVRASRTGRGLVPVFSA